MAPEVVAPASAPIKRGGIDYSKFDAIEDSDEEKPNQSSTKAESGNAAPERPHCHNCHKAISKPLRCGVCKKVSYCAAQCQKDDWRYHKRTCKKPEELKAKEPATRSSQAAAQRRQQKEEKVVVDDEENLTWYRHREWKPAEEKKEFQPKQLSGEEASVVAAESAPIDKAQAGSVWNKAGTWEDKDVTELAKTGLKEQLASVPTVDAAGGIIFAVVEDAITGEASRPVIRGKMRHMFDFNFKVKITFRWMDTDGQKTVEGSVQVSDFTNDTFAEGVLSAPVMELSFSKGVKALDEGRRRAVEAAIGAQSWPPADGTAVHEVAKSMKAWADSFVKG